jgi:hypothetical protein
MLINNEVGYIFTDKNIPRTTASIFITRFMAKPTRKPIIPPEPAENRVEERTSKLKSFLIDCQYVIAIMVSNSITIKVLLLQ